MFVKEKLCFNEVYFTIYQTYFLRTKVRGKLEQLQFAVRDKQAVGRAQHPPVSVTVAEQCDTVSSPEINVCVII